MSKTLAASAYLWLDQFRMSWKKQGSNRWNMHKCICVWLHTFEMHLMLEIKVWWENWWQLLTGLRYRGNKVIWGCVISKGNCLIQKVSISKTLSLWEGGRHSQGWPAPRRWLSWKLGCRPGVRLVLSGTGTGASDGVSHRMETLEQKSVPTHPPGGSRGRSQGSVEGLESTQVSTGPLVLHSCILLLWGSSITQTILFPSHPCLWDVFTGEGVNIY